MALNLLEKIAIGTGVIGALSTLNHLAEGTKAIEDPYIFGLAVIATIGAVYSRTRKRNNRSGRGYGD